jgi:hypothetical protein
MQPPPPSTRFSGTLLRDRGSNYEVRAAGPGAALSDPLSQVLFAAPSQWPVPSTPGQQQALVCIGDAQSLGPDPRISYWLEPYSQGRWGQIQQQIRAMVPMQCPGVSARDFAAVQAALAQEIGWLINTRSYFASLTEPFAQGSQVGLTDVQQIVTDVTQAIAVPPAANAGISGWGIAADIFDAIDFFGGEVEIPGAALFSALFNVAGSLSTSTQDGAPFVWRQKVQATGAQIATATALQLQQIAAGNRRVADIVVADYQKLKTVGTLGGCAPGTPGCAPAWQYTQPQQQATQDLLNISIKRKAWAGLMPAAYPYVLYVNSNPGSYNGTFEGPQTDIGGVGCGFTQQFPLAPPVDLQFGLVQPANTSFLVFAQSNFPGGGGGAPFDAFPPSSLLTNGQASPGAQGQPPFAPLDAGGDPTRGGLGLDQYGFMMESWPWGTPPPVRAEWQGCRS